MTDKWLFLQLPSLRGCDVIPYCDFLSSFDVLALYSNFPNPSGVWFLTFLHDGTEIKCVCGGREEGRRREGGGGRWVGVCVGDHQFVEQETESARELSTVCSQIVLKCMYLARIGRPDICDL